LVQTFSEMTLEEPGKKKDARKELGQAGEKMAEVFLRKQGYRILERNYQTPYGEIDLIARESRETVFIEVRTRRGTDFGTPIESLTRNKISHWEKSASSYLQKSGEFDQPIRFDFVGVDLSGKTPRIFLTRNII
jgi:putative endonuclease